MAYETILVDTQEKVGVILLNHPKELNALCQTMLSELCSALHSFTSKEDIGCIVITGTETIFSAGMDTVELSHYKDYTLSDIYRHPSMELWDNIKHCRKPIIAAVTGYALGTGFELALLCDFILAADNAKFGLPEITRATFPHTGSIQRLTRLIGKPKAAEMILTGRRIEAPEAERIGLVSRVIPAEDLQEEALKTAQCIAQYSQPIVMMAKEAINRAYETSLEEGIRFERTLFYATFATQDQKEGISSFLEKRRPDFKNT